MIMVGACAKEIYNYYADVKNNSIARLFSIGVFEIPNKLKIIPLLNI